MVGWVWEEEFGRSKGFNEWFDGCGRRDFGEQKGLTSGEMGVGGGILENKRV